MSTIQSAEKGQGVDSLIFYPTYFNCFTAVTMEGHMTQTLGLFNRDVPHILDKIFFYSVAGQKERPLWALVALKWVIYQWVLT